MEPPAKKQSERSETDDSLRCERAKTDEELATARAAIEADADQVVERARERAEALLQQTRERTDQEMAAQLASTALQREVERERSDEDRVLSAERSAADELLAAERDERERALADLLRDERDATDEKLAIERYRADRSVATRDEFLGMVSHDLRSLLGGVALNAAVLAKHATNQGDAGSETLRHAVRIQRFTGRMTRLIGDLLDVVSLEAGRLAVSPAPQDAAQLVREAVDTFQPSFTDKRLTLEAQLSAGPLHATFDRERIMQVVANLLSNALKFTPAGGVVTLAAEALADGVRFAVIDSGAGIPAGELEEVFQRFHQVQTADRRGLGLGLYIARCIVEAHGGKIWAERPHGGGTAVYFTVPAAPKAAASA